MDAVTALQTFLAGALSRRRDRYIGFIVKPKTQSKFLNAIYHDLELDFDSAKQIPMLPTRSTPIRGYRYAPPNVFGLLVNDLREACESPDDSFLVVSNDGCFGIHSPESYLDSRRIYRI